MSCYILHLETSSTVCSVSIADQGKEIFFKEEDNGFTHAEHLHVFIQEGLSHAGLKAGELHAVCIGEGPGSYTGLRIGMSAAKGLSYALSIPLITHSTLHNLSIAARNENPSAAFYIPLIDARRMEVYTAIYDTELQQVVMPAAKVIGEQITAEWNVFEGAAFFGSGMSKCKSMLETIKGARFIDGIKPSAQHMHAFAYDRYQKKEFADVAYCEPFYAKEFFDTRKDQKE